MATTDIKVVLSAIDKTQAAFASAKRNIAGLSSSAAGLTRTLGVAIPALTAAGFVAMAKGAIDAADSLKDMSERLGVSVKDLASLKLVAEQNGTSLESLATGMQKLSLSFSQAQGGNKEMAESLKRLGINSGDARERLFQLADAYASAGDKNRVLADAQKVLGKSYAEFIPLLAQGGDELRKAAAASESFAQTMARLAPDADKFNDQLAALKQNAAGAAASIVADLLPALNGLLQSFTNIQRVKAASEGIFDWTLTGPGGQDLKGVTQQIKDIEQALSKASLFDAKTLDRMREQLRILQNVKKVMLEIQAEEALALGKGFENYKIPQKHGVPGANPASPVKTATGSKTDPLASFFKATDTARLKEYNALIADLLRRMAKSKGDTAIFVQALDEINQKFFGESIKAAADWDAAVSEHLQGTLDELDRQKEAWADAGKAIEDEFGNPADKLALRLSYLQELLDRGVISWEAYSNAVLEASMSTGGAVASAEKTKSFTEELGLVFESAFEKAIDAGGGLRDVFKGLVSDVIKLIARMYILKPLLESINAGGTASVGGASAGGAISSLVSSFFSGAGSFISGLFASANGNAFANTPALAAYSGSVVNKPTLFPFASGIGLMGEAGAEAILPLKRGADGKLGVTAGGGSRQIVQNITIQTDNPAAVRASRGQLAADFRSQLDGMARRWG